MPPSTSIKGFDPETWALVLYQMHKADVSRKDDIIIMVAAHIERGNTVSKMNKNSLPSFASTIERLIAVYNLVDKDGSNPMALTLSRVAECFPKLACSYCMSGAKNLTVSIDEMHSVCKGYPKYMMCQAFTALIPKEEEYTQTLLKAHALFLYHFSLKITSYSMKKKSIEKTVQDAWKYMKIVHKRSYMKDCQKKDVLAEVKILGINGLQDSVIKAAEIFDKKYQKYLKNDHNSE
ncbi:uncharacterized protein LOC132950869 [Metopolophium dirhodum]|uniref:uncharacterized protein LOC132950869 n=1 Tax=Metopolophium dirhodum TaxID=44670 RepID=UPI00298F5059|nr:uncharacterized protein LOC132950869 [Metopolophium dirhodum]